MRLRFHRFLLSLLVLVLPLQGLAAALGPSGMSMQQDAPPMLVQAQDCHHASAPEGPAKPASHEGKHCPACVLGAVPLSAIETTPVISNTLRLVVASGPTLRMHVPDGPERPPRTTNL